MTRSLLITLGCVVLLAGAGPVSAAEVAGKIKSIDLAQQELVLVDNTGKEWTLHLAPTTTVRPMDKETLLLESLFTSKPVAEALGAVEALVPGVKVLPRVQYNYKVSDLQPDEEVAVTYDEQDNRKAVSEVRRKPRR